MPFKIYNLQKALYSRDMKQDQTMKFILFIGMLTFFVSSCTNKVEDFEGLIPINGTELYIKTIGTGEPLLFIHGGPGLGFEYFLPQMLPLSKDYKLIFFDQRISGRSSANVAPDSISLAFFVDDIEAIRNHFELERINILAHSWGNLLAAEYALTYNGSIDKLILSNPVPFNQQYAEEIQKLQLAKMDDEFMVKRNEVINSDSFSNRELSAYEKLFNLSFSLSFFDTVSVKEMNFKLFEGFFGRNEKMQYFKGLEEFDYYSKFSKIKAPVLLIRGAYDLSIREADTRAIDSLENSKLIEMKFSGHFPFIEQKEEYLWEIRNFLK